jgi:hypothetical protein
MAAFFFLVHDGEQRSASYIQHTQVPGTPLRHILSPTLLTRHLLQQDDADERDPFEVFSDRVLQGVTWLLSRGKRKSAEAAAMAAKAGLPELGGSVRSPPWSPKPSLQRAQHIQGTGSHCAPNTPQLQRCSSPRHAPGVPRRMVNQSTAEPGPSATHLARWSSTGRAGGGALQSPPRRSVAHRLGVLLQRAGAALISYSGSASSSSEGLGRASVLPSPPVTAPSAGSSPGGVPATPTTALFNGMHPGALLGLGSPVIGGGGGSTGAGEGNGSARESTVVEWVSAAEAAQRRQAYSEVPEHEGRIQVRGGWVEV